MEAGHITPTPSHTDPEWLEARHVHDLEALELAADVIAHQDALITSLEREQAVLIYQARTIH